MRTLSSTFRSSAGVLEAGAAGPRATAGNEPTAAIPPTDTTIANWRRRIKTNAYGHPNWDHFHRNPDGKDAACPTAVLRSARTSWSLHLAPLGATSVAAPRLTQSSGRKGRGYPQPSWQEARSLSASPSLPPLRQRDEALLGAHCLHPSPYSQARRGSLDKLRADAWIERRREGRERRPSAVHAVRSLISHHA